MYHENTTFTLVHYWLESREGWTIDDKHKAFQTILESDVLRFHHMDMEYLAVYAFRTPWMQALDHDIMHRTMLLRFGCGWEAGVQVSQSRSQKSKTCHELEVKVPRDVCAGLPDKKGMYSFIGVVRGLPIYLDVRKWLSDDDGARTVGIFLGWSSGGLPMSGKHTQDVSPIMRMRLDIKAEPDVEYKTVEQRAFDENSAWGWCAFLGPWDEVFAPASNRFVDGVIKVQVKVTTPS